jgi:hypothetical protein
VYVFCHNRQLLVFFGEPEDAAGDEYLGVNRQRWKVDPALAIFEVGG